MPLGSLGRGHGPVRIAGKPVRALCACLLPHPVLKELAAAVSFSPTLSTAVEHDYAQRIDQTQSANGVTMTLNYLMADPAQLIFFVTVTGPEDASLMGASSEAEGPRRGGTGGLFSYEQQRRPRRAVQRHHRGHRYGGLRLPRDPAPGL